MCRTDARTHGRMHILTPWAPVVAKNILTAAYKANTGFDTVVKMLKSVKFVRFKSFNYFIQTCLEMFDKKFIIYSSGKILFNSKTLVNYSRGCPEIT